MIFKGYFKTKNKTPLVNWKETGLITYEQAKTCEEFAGVLADDVILVDIDNATHAEKLRIIAEELQLGCKIVKTTRGYHFFFKSAWHERNGNHVQLAIGLTADIKLGTKNSYAICKFAGKERETVYEAPLEALPKWLCRCKHDINFPELAEGDGRNEALFSHILPLQSAGFTHEEAKETIKLMNRFVLAEPVEDEELEKILRDAAFDRPVFVDRQGRLQHHLMGEHLINRHNVIKIDELLYMYRDGVYVYAEKLLSDEMVRLMPMISKAKRVEVIEYIKIRAPSNVILAEPSLISFTNGVYDLRTGTLGSSSADLIFTNQIPHAYNSDAYHKELDEKLDEWCGGQEDLRALLEEMAGYCLLRSCEFRKVFILVGDTTNGKSTFLRILTEALGKDNCVNIALQNIGDRFQKVLLHRKLANICDDIGYTYIDDSSYLKQISSGDRIMAEIKHGDSFAFNPYSTLVFSANEMPRVRDRTGAVAKRMIIIPFDQVIKEPDRRLLDRLLTEEALQYFIKLAVNGLTRLLANDFTKAKASEKALQRWELDNDSVAAFLYDEEPHLENEELIDVYSHYELYCKRENFMAIGARSFYKIVKARLHLTTKKIRKPGSKTTVNIFVKEGGNDE